MITSSNSPGLGSGMPNHYVGDLRHTLAISGLSHVRTELPHLLVIPLLPPHPIESNREFPRHGLPWQSVSLVAWPRGENGVASRDYCGPSPELLPPATNPADSPPVSSFRPAVP